MENTENKTFEAMQVMVPTREVTTEISGDFSLPDYQPEIRRMLYIRPAVLPASGYLGASGVEVSGSIDYYVTYVGSDGGIYCAPLSSDYAVTVPAELGRIQTNGDVCRIYTRADGVMGRVIAPRKLSVRCRIHTDIRLYGECDLNVPSNGIASETLIGNCVSAKVFTGRSDLIRLTDDIISGQSGDYRVICAEGNVLVTQTEPGIGAVNCRGDVILKFLTAPEGDGGNPAVTIRKIPFSQIVMLPGCTPESAACANGCCSELSIEIGDGNLHAELGVILDVCAAKNTNVEYPEDMYGTECKTQCGYAKIPTSELLGCVNGNFTFGESVTLESVGIESKASIIDSWGNANAENLTFENGRCFLTGNAEFTLLYVLPDGNGGEKNTVNIEVPFRYEVPGIDTAPDGFEATVRVPTNRVRIDGERLGIDAEISVCGQFYKRAQIDCVSELTKSGEHEPFSGIRICYPERGDTLWSVSKRAGACASEVSKQNGLKIQDVHSPLSGVKYLFI